MGENYIDRAKSRVLVNEHEACEILGVSLAWLKRSAADGTMPHVMIGRRRMYPWEKCRNVLMQSPADTQLPPMPPAVKRLVDAAVDLLEQANEWNTIARSEGLGPDDTTTGPTRSAIAAVRAMYRSEP